MNIEYKLIWYSEFFSKKNQPDIIVSTINFRVFAHCKRFFVSEMVL